MTPAKTTLDGLLNRRVMLEQLEEGYRVAVDTVFLAAAVPAREGDRVLDLGCGVGGAMLCLACRVEGISGTGLDIQHDLVEICRRNIERNAFAASFEVRHEDATQLPSDLYGAFDHVLMNPPYHEEHAHDPSPNAVKRKAHAEKDGDLGLWISAAAAALKKQGTLTLIHRAERREDIIAALKSAFGQIEILPLLPKEGVPPKRLVIRAHKGATFSVKECKPLILHKDRHGYTDAAEAVLREAESVGFVTV